MHRSRGEESARRVKQVELARLQNGHVGCCTSGGMMMAMANHLTAIVVAKVEMTEENEGRVT